MEIKHIFLATDLTGRSDRALQRAVRLASETDADLTVLSVIERGLPPKIVARRKAETREEIETRVAALTGPANIRVRINVIEGDPFSAILSEAAQWSADVIILGAHAKLGYPEVFAGTTTERVTRFADRPVLLISSEASNPYSRIVAAADLKENAAQALVAASALAPKAELHVILAWRIPAAMYPGQALPSEKVAAEERRLRALLEEHAARHLEGLPARRSPTKVELVEGAAADVIRNAVERLKPDLLALGAYSRSGLWEGLLGSTTRELLVDAPCDILVARA